MEVEYLDTRSRRVWSLSGLCLRRVCQKCMEFNKADMGLSHHSALECIGESQGDGNGELTA